MVWSLAQVSGFNHVQIMYLLKNDECRNFEREKMSS